MFEPNPNWTAAIAQQIQAPIYVAQIEGLGTDAFSTGPVKSAKPWVERVAISAMEGRGQRVDLASGDVTVGSVTVDVLNTDGRIFQLVATEASGAPLATLANRRLDVYAGYRNIIGNDYPRVFRGRITDIVGLKDHTGFRLTAEDVKRGLDVPIMTGATDDSPVIIEGNPINVLGAVLLNVFSLSDTDFPLTAITGTPIGAGLDRATDVAVAQLKDIRDTWFVDVRMRFKWTKDESCSGWVAKNFFQLIGPAVIDGYGRIGLYPWEPSVAGAVVPTLTDDDVVRVDSWRRRPDLHVNRVRIRFNWDPSSRVYGDNPLLPDEVVAEDTADQAATGAVRLLDLTSEGIREDLNGTAIASVLTHTLLRWRRKPPVEIVVSCPFTKRNLEVGDVAKVTLRNVLDVKTGTRGITNKLMRVVEITPKYSAGLLSVTLVEVAFLRYGFIPPNSLGDYPTWTQAQKDRYYAIGRTSDNRVNAGTEEGYAIL